MTIRSVEPGPNVGHFDLLRAVRLLLLTSAASVTISSFLGATGYKRHRRLIHARASEKPFIEKTLAVACHACFKRWVSVTRHRPVRLVLLILDISLVAIYLIGVILVARIWILTSPARETDETREPMKKEV